MSVNAYYRRDDESKAYVGFIRELRIYTQSKTIPTLKEAVADAVKVFTDICRQRGILAKVIAERKDTPLPADYHPLCTVSFEV